MLRYVGRGDYWVFSFELVFMCFVIYYIVEEVMEIKKVKLEYFNSAWNIMDCVLIVISLFNILIAVYTEFVVTAVLKVSLTFACILAIYTLYIHIISAITGGAPNIRRF